MYAGDNGYVYELPYYQPYQSYEANDGSQFMQDGYGDYYQYDNYGHTDGSLRLLRARW